jgi:hypothetical protein
MSAIWERFKWVITHALWFIAGLILLIDPRHIDQVAEKHPAWSAVILAAWAILLAWATKQRTAPPGETFNLPRSKTPQPPQKGLTH